MKISDILIILKNLQEEHGDLKCEISTDCCPYDHDISKITKRTILGNKRMSHKIIFGTGTE